MTDYHTPNRLESPTPTDVNLPSPQRAREGFRARGAGRLRASRLHRVRFAQRPSQRGIFIHDIDEFRFETIDRDAVAKGGDDHERVVAAGERFDAREKRPRARRVLRALLDDDAPEIDGIVQFGRERDGAVYVLGVVHERAHGVFVSTELGERRGALDGARVVAGERRGRAREVDEGAGFQQVRERVRRELAV